MVFFKEVLHIFLAPFENMLLLAWMKTYSYVYVFFMNTNFFQNVFISEAEIVWVLKTME